MANECVCPHCGAVMDPIETPLDSSWGGEIHYVCFNDDCGYFVNSWGTLESQGIEKAGYRCRIDARGACGPIPVWSVNALKDHIVCNEIIEEIPEERFDPDDFLREDETPDSEFYRTPRLVDHLDSVALSTVEDLYARLIPKKSRILDLMAGPDSHLRGEIKPERVVGLGLNDEELAANKALDERVIHDLNENPTLPFQDNEFDVVVNSVSVDYMTRPVDVFRDVARVLKPHGLLIVIFSNRMFPPKAVNIWKKTNEAQRVDLVREYLSFSGMFSVDGYFESTGKPRPQNDKYYLLGIPSDPVYALWGTVVK